MLHGIPAYIKLDNENVKYERILFNDLRINIINTFEEATDPDTLYVLISEEISKLPNVFVKRPKRTNGDDITPTVTSISSVNDIINLDDIINQLIVEPDINENVKKYIKGEIDIDVLVE